jgi:hypothetical protein
MLEIHLDPPRNATCEIKFILARYPPSLRILPQYRKQKKDHIEADYIKTKQNWVWGRDSIFGEKSGILGA